MVFFNNSFSILIVLMLSACATSSGERIRKIAEKKNFHYQVQISDGLSHAVYFNGIEVGQDKILNVYLEGDGMPWQFRYFISPDPTPRKPLMLELMALDERSAVYIGRPCYYGFAKEPGCGPDMWTVARHSNRIVSTVSDVIRKMADQLSAQTLRLFGHSGGGAMAMLVAARLDSTATVVTLAGNLDLKAWTDLHGYTPLYGSLNPATQAPLNSAIRQYHLMGAQDTKIPPDLVLDWVSRQVNTQYHIFNDFRHGCCWEHIWPAMLRFIDKGTNGSLKTVFEDR